MQKKGLLGFYIPKKHNTTQACVIIDHLLKNHKVPEYYLLKAEMASYQGDSVQSKEHMQQFFTLANNPLYGEMYNTHKIKALVETDPQQALQLAQREVDNRPTPAVLSFVGTSPTGLKGYSKAAGAVQPLQIM